MKSSEGICLRLLSREIQEGIFKEGWSMLTETGLALAGVSRTCSFSYFDGIACVYITYGCHRIRHARPSYTRTRQQITNLIRYGK